MKKITVLIDDNGNLHADFSGFQDRTCGHEEERFRKLLVDLGLTVKTEKTTKKSEEQIQAELNRNSANPSRGTIRQ